MVADYLLSFGLDRIQKSVYQGDLSAFELKEIKLQMKTIKFDVDILFIPQCAKCAKKQVRIIYPDAALLIPELITDMEEKEEVDPSNAIQFFEVINFNPFETGKFQITELILRKSIKKKGKKQGGAVKIIEKVIVLDNMEVVILG